MVVGEELARRLIGGQFREFREARVRLLGEGWDNTVWLADDRVVFRFPRRTMAVPGLEEEIRLLPVLAPLLPAPIPVPTYLGSPTAEFPWPFFGADLIRGDEPADAGLDGADRIRLARPLGEFLQALHSVRIEADLRLDANRRADMRRRVPATRQALVEAQDLGLWRPPAYLAEQLAAAERLPPTDASVVAHGDLHLRHLLVRPGGGLAGIIDWNDVCRASPSIDLVLYWSLLPPAGRPELLAAYGPISDQDLMRARVLSLNLCAVLAVYARRTGNRNLEAVATRGLELTATE